MRIIETFAARPPVASGEPEPGRLRSPVPAHITAAALSLGISAAQVREAISIGSSLPMLAKARGISQEDLVAAMRANPPAGFLGLAVAEGARSAAARPRTHVDVMA